MYAIRSYYGIAEGAPGDHPVIGLELGKLAEQGIHCGIPGLMGGGMGKLVGAGDIAGTENIRIAGSYNFV